MQRERRAGSVGGVAGAELAGGGAAAAAEEAAEVGDVGVAEGVSDFGDVEAGVGEEAAGEAVSVVAGVEFGGEEEDEGVIGAEGLGGGGEEEEERDLGKARGMRLGRSLFPTGGKWCRGLVPGFGTAACFPRPCLFQRGPVEDAAQSGQHRIQPKPDA